MKLSEYARKIGVGRHTAYRWFKRGEIPGATQLPSGTIYVPDSIFENYNGTRNGITVIYARVSSIRQGKTNLESQVEQLTQFAIANGWVVGKVIKEVSSGLNVEYGKLTDLLMSDVQIARIIIENKDGLTHFGFNYLEILAKKQGFEIVVVNPMGIDKEDLMQDFTSIIESVCAQLYSKHEAKRRTGEIIKILQRGDRDETCRKTLDKRKS